jgi:hypothetical protein
VLLKLAVDASLPPREIQQRKMPIGKFHVRIAPATQANSVATAKTPYPRRIRFLGGREAFSLLALNPAT